jgi:hypothetical protein
MALFKLTTSCLAKGLWDPFLHVCPGDTKVATYLDFAKHMNFN